MTTSFCVRKVRSFWTIGAAGRYETKGDHEMQTFNLTYVSVCKLAHEATAASGDAAPAAGVIENEPDEELRYTRNPLVL